MPRLLALTGVVLIALVGAGSAQATHGVPGEFDPSADEQFWEIVNEDFNPLDSATQDALDRLPDMTEEERDEYLEKWKDGDADAKMRSRRWPRLRAFGGSILVSVAASVGLDYALKMEIPGQGFIYSLITGDSYGGAGTGNTNVRWECLGASPCVQSTVAGRSDGYWWMRSDQIGTAGFWWSTSTPGSVGTYIPPPPPSGACRVFGSSHANDTFCPMAVAADATEWYWSAASSSDRFVAIRTDAAMEAAVMLEESDATEYAAHARKLDAGTYNPPTATTGDKEAAWSYGDTTNVTNEWRTYIYLRMHPEEDLGDHSAPLLQPLPNETYTAYITRLEGEGYIGTATTTEVSAAQLAYGPSAVVRVIATPIGGTSTVYDPLNWPTTDPIVAEDAELTIRYNPTTAPEAPTTQTPTPITGTPTTIPGTPAVDFSPITDLDPGCKFPYGFVCYAVDFTEQFSVAADAPVFSFDLGVDIPLCNDCEAAYVVDLEVMDGYMALWRGILTVVLWVGAIYLVATRLLGFNAGGDPGEAMDDVL